MNGPTNLVLDLLSPTYGPISLSAAVLPVPENGPLNLRYKFTVLDSKARVKPKNSYFFNARTSSLAGPFNTEITTITSRDNSSEIYAVDENMDILQADMLELNDPHFDQVSLAHNYEDDFHLGSYYGFVGNKKGQFLYRRQYLANPFDKPIKGNGEVSDPMFFKNFDLSIAETHWMHFGSEAAEKDVYRIDLSFHKNSYGFLWLFIQNDEGKTSGQFKGEIQETVKVFTNLRGRRFRVKMFIGTHPDYPWAMREMAVGYNLGKSF